MAEGCSTDGNICCYTDDSGAENLLIICMGLATALLISVIALAWICVKSSIGETPRSKRVGRGTRTNHRAYPRDENENKNTGLLSSSSSGVAGIRKGANDEFTRSGSPEGALSLEDMEKGTTSKPLKRPVSNRSLRDLKTVYVAGQDGDGINNAADVKRMGRSQSMRMLKAPEEVAHHTRVRSSSCGALEPPSPGSSVGPDTVHRLRVLLDTERSRRMAAESVIGRRANAPGSLGTPGSRTSLRKFPGPRAIEAHALEATANAARWAQSATAHARPSEPELPNLIIGVLVHAYLTCRAEVTRRLDIRVEGLRVFVGGGETIVLGAKDGVMAGDTQELLYRELRRRFQSITHVGRQELVKLSAGILTRALETEDKRDLGRKLMNQTWPTFEPLMRSYLALFVECALQRPSVEFEEIIAKEEPFDANKHRELARFVEPEGNTCAVVFPSLKASTRLWLSEDGTRSDALRSGVIAWSTTKYFQL